MSENPIKPVSDSPNVAQTPVFDLRGFLAGGREAIIVHAGERYRLRVTANDKLILTMGGLSMHSGVAHVSFTLSPCGDARCSAPCSLSSLLASSARHRLAAASRSQ